MTWRGDRRSQLQHLHAKQLGKCFICKCDTVLEPTNGGKLKPNAAVRFRLGSSFGSPGRVRPRVMTCRKCAQERSDEIQQSQPLEDLWLRSGREPTELWGPVSGKQEGTCPES